MSKNLRHAAALALVGWYLIVMPPTAEDIDPVCHGLPGDGSSPYQGHCLSEAYDLKPEAPLGKWLRTGHFDSLHDCEVSRERETPELRAMMKRALHSLVEIQPKLSEKDGRRTTDHQLAAERCIASDNPRLKEK